MSRKIFVIINPESGRGLGRKLAKKCRKILNEDPAVVRWRLVFTESKGENTATNLAKQAQEQGFKEIVIIGGDGTDQQVIKGLCLPDLSISLSIIPVGRVNNLASALGIPRNMNRALDLALNGKNILCIDLGMVNDEPYVGTFSIGIDARISARAFDISVRLRQLPFWKPLYFLWELPFYWAGMKELWQGIPCVQLTLRGGISKQTSTVLLAVNNVAKYAHWFNLAPGARVDDGLLDVCLIAGPVNRREILSIVLRATQGIHIESPKVSLHQIGELIIESKEPLIGQVDGEPMKPQKRFEVSILPSALNVVVPETLNMGFQLEV